MKIFNTKTTTQELICLGMALQGDKDTLETRIRGIFSRKRSTGVASIAAMVLVFALVFACFTTACQPVVATAAAETVTIAAEKTTLSAQEEALLRFDGYAKGTLDGNKITVTDAKGTKHEFTWVDEGVRKSVDGTRELSEPIPEGTYAAPGEVALRAAETAVTVFGDDISPCEIHINMYTGNGLELVYYGVGFGGTPFESAEQIYGYADAVTGTILTLDANYYGRIVQKYGDDTINEKVRASWDMSREQYASFRTSEKALDTAMELVRACFPTGEIVPKDATVWDAGSHTDGEEMLWAGGYVAVVDAYIRMDKDPCYYVQVAVPLDEGADPCITIFGCYPLGWEYCCNQIHDPAVLKQEMEDLEAIRSGTLSTDDEANAPAAEEDIQLAANAAQAEEFCGSTFTPKADMWKQGDGAEEYSKVFLVKYGMYPDDGYISSEPMTDPAKVVAMAKRGNVLRFEWNGQGLYAVYLGDGLLAYADAERMMVRNAYVVDWLKDKEGKPDCTCCILTW